MNLVKVARRLVAPALPLVAVPLLLAGPASAQTLHGTDTGHDVQKFDMSAFTHKVAPAHADADLLRYTVDYGPRAIRVTETYRALDHSEPLLAVGGTFKLPDGSTHDLVLRAQKGNWRGTAKLQHRPACAIRHHLDYAKAQSVIVVPASCLGTPAWVRFAAAAVTTDHWKKPTYFYADAAPAKSVTQDRYTARIFRG
ncbi:MAG TPA: hypothetical protein VFM01_19150 [Nakamurella sp.]|nr:hypothetical protein [Nakamurella sp.]